MFLYLKFLFFILSALLIAPNLSAQDDINSETTLDSTYLNPNSVLSGKWRFGLQNGFSYMFASTSDMADRFVSAGADQQDTDDFLRQIRRGYYFSADAHYLLPGNWGIGLKYSIMASTSEQYVSFDVGDGLNQLNTELYNREYVNYIGVSFFIQQRFRQAPALTVNSSLSLGYAHYRDEFETDFKNYYLNGNTLYTDNAIGGNIEIGLEYFPSQWISIAIGLDCFLAKFKHISASDQDPKSISLIDKDSRNVSRFGLFLGVRFYLK